MKSLTLADLGLTDIKSMTFSVDGATFYVLGTGPEVEGSAPQKIVGYNASTGEQVSSVDVSGNVGDVSGLITPEVLR